MEVIPKEWVDRLLDIEMEMVRYLRVFEDTSDTPEYKTITQAMGQIKAAQTLLRKTFK